MADVKMLQTINKYSNWLIAAALVGVLLLYMRPTNKRDIEPSNDSQFQDVVAGEMRPVLVKFGATWCGPCVSTDRALAEYESTSTGDVKVVIMDVDSNPTLSQHYGVRSIPHSFLFLHGKVIDDRVGGMDAQEIKSWIKSNESSWKNQR
jgi:thioredoxin 1